MLREDHLHGWTRRSTVLATMFWNASTKVPRSRPPRRWAGGRRARLGSWGEPDVRGGGVDRRLRRADASEDPPPRRRRRRRCQNLAMDAGGPRHQVLLHERYLLQLHVTAGIIRPTAPVAPGWRPTPPAGSGVSAGRHAMASDFSVTRESKPRADERLTGIANFRGAVSRLPRLIDSQRIRLSLVVQMPGSHWPKLGRCIKSSIQGSGPRGKSTLAKGFAPSAISHTEEQLSALTHPTHQHTSKWRHDVVRRGLRACRPRRLRQEDWRALLRLLRRDARRCQAR